MSDQHHILMTGGGTLGPVTPLLAIVDQWRKQDPTVRVTWIGTPGGPEREIIESHDIEFRSLKAPKMSRHKPWLWPLIPLMLAYSSFRAYSMLHDDRPDMIFSAGGFTSVPIVWVGKFMRIPSWIHQLDVQPGLANRLMAFAARRISVTWSESAAAFPKKKTDVYGGLARPDVLDGNGYRFLKRYGLNYDLPTVLVLGGGTGAASINQAVEVTARELAQNMNLILLTGKGKMTDRLKQMEVEHFLAKEFLNEEMADALDAADVVVARAGMGTISELVALRKPTVLIPIMGSHQEHNAEALEQRDAVQVLRHFTPQILAQTIRKLSQDKQVCGRLSKQIGQALDLGAAKRIVHEARQMI